MKHNNAQALVTNGALYRNALQPWTYAHGLLHLRLQRHSGRGVQLGRDARGRAVQRVGAYLLLKLKLPLVGLNVGPL